MKTIIGKTAAVLALALMTTGAFAANNNKEKEVMPNQVTTSMNYDNNMVGVQLNIDNATEGESTVIITDAFGNVVLTDTFTNDKSTVAKSYLLEDDTQGDYTITVQTAAPTLQKK